MMRDRLSLTDVSLTSTELNKYLQFRFFYDIVALFTNDNFYKKRRTL